MNIGLVDVDGHNFPNFALMRLSAYNKAKGCQVDVDGHNFPNFALMRLSAYNKAKGCQVE